MSLGMPRRCIPATAPNTPKGTTSSTASGMLQLSYSAARQRNTARIENAYRIIPDEPAFFSSSDWPVHS